MSQTVDWGFLRSKCLLYSHFHLRMRYILASVYYSMYVPRFVLRSYHFNVKVSQAFQGVISDLDSAIELLESIESFLNRLDIYTKVPSTPAMSGIIVKIMVELLSTLALATNQIRQGQPSELVFANLLPGSTQCREICKEAFRREPCQCGSSEARPTEPGRGSNDGSADT
jgi:hypothetical protein